MFHYTNQSGCQIIEGVDDSEEFKNVQKAFQIIGMSQQEKEDVLQVIYEMKNDKYQFRLYHLCYIWETSILFWMNQKHGLQPKFLQRGLLRFVLHSYKSTVLHLLLS